MDSPGAAAEGLGKRLVEEDPGEAPEGWNGPVADGWRMDGGEVLGGAGPSGAGPAVVEVPFRLS